MKKKTLLLSMLLVNARMSFAQKIFGNAPTEVQTEVESWFPIAMGVADLIILIFIVVGNFTGDNRDIKKGVGNVLMLITGNLIIVAVYRWATSLTL